MFIIFGKQCYPFFMNRAAKKQKLRLLSLLVLALFSYPFLSIPDRSGLFLGLPPLFIYIFLLWLLVIGITARITYKPKKGRRE